MNSVEWVVELEAGVWLAPWPGDPGRTLVAGSAKRFPTPTAAYRALAAALRYHGFMGAQVMASVDGSERVKG